MKVGSALRTLRFIIITVVLFVLSFSAVVVTVLNIYVPQYLARIGGEEVGYFASPAEFDEVYEKLVSEKKADGIKVEVYLASEPEFELKYVRENTATTQNKYTNLRAFVKTEYTVYTVSVKGNEEMTFASKKDADSYASKIKKAVKSTVKSTVKVAEVKKSDLVKTTEVASAEKIYTELVSRYKPVIRTYTYTSSGSSGSVSYGGKPSATLSAFIAGGRRPTSGVVYQGYGVRNYALYGNSIHTGIDIADNSSPNIYPYKSGIVTFVGYASGYGNYIKVSHGTDGNGNELVTLYAHLKSGTTAVSVGQSVSQSTVLGRMGTTGLSTGIHLHFEIRIVSGGKSTTYNPAYFI